ncbi:MAG: VTT domain-containing protein [Candidatus Aenigmarchaeota archaeon]|nr:VTT domain-containing protein [Candidatus Aenigmarchaeota archaeon]
MVFGIDALIALANSFGYLGVILIGFLSSFLIFIPSPAWIAVFLLGAVMNPLLLGLAAGLGAAIGEMTGYGIGLGIQKLAARRKKDIKKQVMKIKKLFGRYHPDLIIFVFAAAPILPIDAVGIFCGYIKYDKKRFFTFVLIGKIIKYILIAYAGFYGLNWVLHNVPLG